MYVRPQYIVSISRYIISISQYIISILSSTNGDGAFTHYYVYVEKNKQVGHLKPHPSLYGLFKKLHGKDEALSFVMSSAELPMLVPPQPWTNSNEGGYVLIPCERGREGGREEGRGGESPLGGQKIESNRIGSKNSCQ